MKSKNIYQQSFSALVDILQDRGLYISRANLLTNGIWKIIAICRHKGETFSCRFTFFESESKLRVEIRKFFFYCSRKDLKITSANYHIVVKEAVNFVFSNNAKAFTDTGGD